MAAKRGSKLNKSEVVQVRLDPILKMAVELAAAKERRTLSSYIEWSVEKTVKKVTVIESGDTEKQITAWDVAQECWEFWVGGRIQFLANKYPELLTIRERGIFSAMQLARRLVSDNEDDADLVRETLLIHGWEIFCQFADGQISTQQLWEGVQRLRGRISKDLSTGVWVYAADTNL